MKSFVEQAAEEFEKYWGIAPPFPIVEERELHRVTAETAFYAGISAGIEMAMAKMREVRTGL